MSDSQIRSLADQKNQCLFEYRNLFGDFDCQKQFRADQRLLSAEPLARLPLDMTEQKPIFNSDHSSSKALGLFFCLALLCLGQLYGQDFSNSDLDGGSTFSYSQLPTGWQKVPVGDPVSLASNPNIGDTPDLTNASGPGPDNGVAGDPFSGNSFVCGLRMNGSSVSFHEGIQQTVEGLVVGQTYAINFYQAVVKQIFALDGSGSWSVYMDALLLEVTEPSSSNLGFNDIDLAWEARSVSFIPTSPSHTFKFMPTDNDDNSAYSFTDTDAGLRMGIDLITINSDCILDLGPDVSLCDSDLPFEIGTTLSGSYLWNTGDETASLEVGVAGTYVLEVTSDCGVLIDSVVVSISEAVDQVDLGEDLEICPQDFPLILTADVEGEYSWNTLQGTQSITVEEPGTYFVTVSNSCSSSFDAIVITEIPGALALNLGPDIALCESELPYELGTLLEGVYAWNTGDETATIQVTTEGVYALEITSTCGVSIDSITVSIIEVIEDVDLGEDLVVCAQDFPVILTADVLGDYSWSTFESSQSITVNAPGTYSLTVSNACSSSLDSVTIVEAPGTSTLSLGADIFACAADFPFTLDAGVYESYAWASGEDVQTISVAAPGDYAVTVFNSCGTASDELTIFLVEPPAEISLGDDFAICEDQFPIELEIEETNLDVEWSTGSTSEIISVFSEGIYAVSVSNQCGVSDASILISSIPNPLESELLTLCQGEFVEFLGENYSVEGVYEVIVPATEIGECDTYWTINVNVIPLDTIVEYIQIGEGEIVYYNGEAFDESGLYYLTEPTEGACDRIVKLLVDVEDEIFVYVPSAFSPDNDGVNDYFKPVLTLLGDLSLNLFEFEIYDRFGHIIYETSDISTVGWNGSGYMDSNYYVQDGVYTWVLRYATTNGGDKNVEYGSVFMMR